LSASYAVFFFSISISFALISGVRVNESASSAEINPSLNAFPSGVSSITVSAALASTLSLLTATLFITLSFCALVILARVAGSVERSL
jgi:hypothetical protein